ncbi:hypothetical protein AKJ49_00450, partial [candidate division MSBL1 archaeon SCGC-AAA382A03]
KGEFNLEIKPMEENAATTENIAKEIAKEIYEKTNRPIRVKVYEGKKSFAICKWPIKGEINE